jgi:hypothetical protein
MIAGRTIVSRVTWLLAMSALVGTGCSTTNPQGLFKETPPTGVPTRILTMWDPQVHLNPDSLHDGNPFPTLTGDIYLVGEGSQFITANGNMVVDLYDTTNGQRIPLERWVFDPATLKALTVKNMMGWHWQLIMPWGSYRPEITNIALKACLVREKEKVPPLYADEAPVTLVRPDNPLVRPGQKRPELMAQNGRPASNQGVQQVSQSTTSSNYRFNAPMQGMPQGTQAMPQGTQAMPQGTQAMPQGTQAMLQGAQAMAPGIQATPQGMQVMSPGMQATPQGMQVMSPGMQATPQGLQPMPPAMQSLGQAMPSMPQGMQGMQQPPLNLNPPPDPAVQTRMPVRITDLSGQGIQQQPMMNQPVYGSGMQQSPMMNQPVNGSGMEQPSMMNPMMRQ